MSVTRREFFKGCAALGVLMVPGMARAASGPVGRAADSRIEKSIKAGFGGGFSLCAHGQSNGLTYAEIEHSGNRYIVASADLIDWEIMSTA